MSENEKDPEFKEFKGGTIALGMVREGECLSPEEVARLIERREAEVPEFKDTDLP